MLQSFLTQWAEAIITFGVAFAAVAFLQAIFGQGRPYRHDYKRWAYNIGLTLGWTAALSLFWPHIWSALQTIPKPNWESAIGTDQLPVSLEVAGSVILLDFVQYVLHRALHRSDWLWWTHALHHSDTQVDATTGVRHNPVEPLLGAVVQGFFIVLLGMAAGAVVIYALLANLQAVLAHSELRLSKKWDHALGFLMVTPGLHRLHHVAIDKERAVNFGVLFSFWDRVFGSFLESDGFDPRLKFGIVPMVATNERITP